MKAILILTLFLAQESYAVTKICLMGEYYYHWKGRPFGLTIPVINPKTGNPIKCKDDSYIPKEVKTKPKELKFDTSFVNPKNKEK